MRFKLRAKSRGLAVNTRNWMNAQKNKFRIDCRKLEVHRTCSFFRILPTNFKNLVSTKTRLKFSFYVLFICRRSSLKVHILKTKQDIEKSFGTVIPVQFSYKKIQKRNLDIFFSYENTPLILNEIMEPFH